MISAYLRHITSLKRPHAKTHLSAPTPLLALGAVIIATLAAAIYITFPTLHATAQDPPEPQTPGTPQNLTSESIENGIYIEWRKPDGGPSIACYYVRYRVAEQSGNPAGAWQPGDDGKIVRSSSVEIYNLEIGTTYDIQVRAYSEKVDAHSDWVPISHMMHQASNDSSLKSLSLSQGTLSPAFDPQSYNSVNVYTATVPHSVSTVTVTPTANHSAATISIKGKTVTSGSPSDPISLTPGDNMIDIWVQAEITGYNRSYVVNVNRAPSTQQLAAPTNLTLTQGAQDLKHYITLSWTPPSGATGAILEYRVNQSHSEPLPWKTDGVTDLTANGGKIHAHLRDSSDYEVRVAGTDSSNTPGEYAIALFHAKSSPDYLYDMTVTPGDESLTVSWLDPENPSIENYRVRWREIQDHPCCPWTDEFGNDIAGQLIGKENTSYTISGLTNGQLYEVQVRAINNLGNGPWSPATWESAATGTPQEPMPGQQQGQNQLIQSTPVPEPVQNQSQQDSEPQLQQQSPQTETPPGTVQNLQLDARGNKIIVSWDAPATGDAPTRYHVTLQDSEGGKPKVRRPGPKKLKIVYRNLQSGKTYQISVLAKNNAGKSELTSSSVTLD